MKKILIASLLALTFASTAQAQWHHGGGHYYWRPGYGWVVPAIVGGAIVYEATRPVTPNVVVVQPTPVYPAPPAPAVAPPAGYHYEAIVDASCNCYKTVLIAN